MKFEHYLCSPFADVAKLVDAPDLGSGAARRVGSIPIIRTKKPADTAVQRASFFERRKFAPQSALNFLMESHKKIPYKATNNCGCLDI